jgi:hypothetical protein
MLFPECVEDWIGEDNPVRVIDGRTRLMSSIRSGDGTKVGGIECQVDKRATPPTL